MNPDDLDMKLDHCVTMCDELKDKLRAARTEDLQFEVRKDVAKAISKCYELSILLHELIVELS